MKLLRRTLSILLSLSLILSGCGAKQNTAGSKDNQNTKETTIPGNSENNSEKDPVETSITVPMDGVVDFTDASLSDPDLLRYIEDTAYSQLVASLGSTEYFVENVQAIYISKEYLQELEYNSRANIFFGYTLSDLDKQFQGTKYVFTLDTDGQTTVKELVEFTDDTDIQIMKNVAIGSGVILLCVAVSVVSGGAGAPAACAIFAASAKTGAIMALSGGLFGGVSAGIVKGIETHDFDQALKAAALAGSEGFKWGAISGAIIGGTSEAIALKGAAANLKSMDLAAKIQHESGYPLDVIKQFHSYEEYEVFKNAGLQPAMVNGKLALIRTDIDLTRLDEFGRSNLQRMQKGLSPLDSLGKEIQLHHIGQRNDATLAILTESEHHNAALHGFVEKSEINRVAFKPIREAFWKTMANILGGT